MNNEPTHVSVSLADLSEARWKSGDLYVYHHKVRCPDCNGFWRFEVAAPRGAIDPHPDPAKVVDGLLCGVCTARRKAFAILPVEGMKPRLGRFFDPESERKVIFGKCMNHNGRMPVEITRGEVWDRVTPLLDERSDQERRILEVDGKRQMAITPQRLQALGLNWPVYEDKRV